MKHSEIPFAAPNRPSILVNLTTKQLSIRKWNPSGFNECSYSHFQKSQKFVLGSGVDLNTLTEIDNCYEGVELLLYYMCSISVQL